MDGGALIPLVTLPLRIKYDSTVPVGVFSRGMSAVFEAAPGYDVFHDEPALSSHGTIRYGWVPGNKHNIEAYGFAGFDAVDRVFLTERGGGRGERTLERSNVLTGAIASGDLSYQYAFWSNDAVTLTATAFTEAGVYSHELFETPGDFFTDGTNADFYTSYYGLGAGMRLYVRKIAIPAMGFDVGYSVNDSDFRFSFSIGMTM